MLETIKALCARRGVSGDEGPVRDYIKSCAAPFADDMTTDAAGNLIVFKKGKKTPARKVMLCAHMDEVGVIITGVTDDGYLKFESVGSIDRRVLIGKTVKVGKGDVFGVIGIMAYHLVKKDEREKIPALSDMYIDIGANKKEDALRRVSPGDTGTFNSAFVEFGNGFLSARALDDRVGCAVLMKLIKSELPVDCTFAFTVQEEVGTRGAAVASFRVTPDIALIIESTTAADLPSVPPSKKVCSVGKGAVIPFMDNAAIYDKELYRMLTSLADKNDIPWQTKSYISGGTDAGAIQRSRGGVMTAGIAAPVRNLHSPSNVACMNDIEAVYRLAGLFINEIGEKY
ncbi:MAG: M42 family metallopeptidase [Clostridiales bacterium]|nr:M42 family metallopeptidase [Clostridiales bacterium]